MLFRLRMRIDYSLGLSFFWNIVIKLSSLGPIFEAPSVKSSLVELILSQADTQL